MLLMTQTDCSWLIATTATTLSNWFQQNWRSGSALVLINEVNLCWDQLVLGWVTMCGFNSQGQHFISVRNQPPRSTQPSTLRRKVK